MRWEREQTNECGWKRDHGESGESVHVAEKASCRFWAIEVIHASLYNQFHVQWALKFHKAFCINVIRKFMDCFRGKMFPSAENST